MSIRHSVTRCISGLILNCALVVGVSSAAEFNTGPVFQDYGKKVVVEGVKFNANTEFKVAFDVAKGAEPGKLNRQFDSLARFINMHVANGVPAENIHLALVVHGKAGFDLLKSPLYQEKFNSTNANSPLLQDLMKNQVQIYLCGQSAAYYDIDKPLLEPGVKMALSAMTAHAVLNSKGYSLNPF